MHIQVEWFVFIVPVSVLLLLASLISFHKYTGLGRDKSFLALLASFLAADVQSLRRAHELEQLLRPGDAHLFQNLEIVCVVAAAGLVFPLLVAFVLRLWGRWIGGQTTAEERLPGAAGLQAWFSASNVAVALLLIVCAWLGHDISPLLTTVVLGAILAAQPLLGLSASAPICTPTSSAGFAAVPRPPADDLSAEREKIVAMLEAGKLTPEESAELLQALGESSRRATQPAPLPLTSHQRLMLIGAAAVALGFFLPWFTINPGQEATRLMGQMKLNLHLSGMESFPMDAGIPGSGLPMSTGGPPFKTGSVSYSGGDIARGLGWATLALALAAALLPYVATNIDDRTARTIRLLCLGVGAFIVLYLLSQATRFIGIGLVIAIAGYGLEIAGALREQRSAVT